MVVRDFYNTDLTIGNDNIELSDNVDDLSLAYPDGWSDAYWYGWLKWDTAPDAIKLSGVTCVGDTSGWTYTALHGSPNNFNIGYAATGFMSSSLQWYSPINQIQPYTNVSSVYHDPISAVSPLMGTRFINAMDPQGVTPIHGGAAAAGENRIYVAVHVTDNGGRNDISVTTPNFENTANGIYDFFSGNLTKSITLSSYALDDSGSAPKNYSLAYTLDINSADFGKTHANVWTVDFTSGGNSFTANIWICGFNLPVGADKLDADTSYTHNTLRVLPLIDQKYNDNSYKTVGVFAYMHYMRFDNGAYQSESGAWGSATTDIAADTNLYTGGYYGTIDTTGIKRYEAAFDDAANFCVVNWTKSTSQTQNRIFRIIAPEEALKLFALNMRYVVNDSYNVTSYGFGSGIYVPHISEDNEYLCEFLTGNFVDIEDELRPWQYENIRDNTYDPNQPEPSGANNFYFGGNQIQSLYYGGNEIQALYYGPYLIFPTTPPTPSNPYTEISYIEATGTQYINTGYTQQSNSLRIKMTVRPAFIGNTGKIIAAPNFGLKVVWYGTIQGRFYGIDFYVNDSALFSGGIWHDPQSYFTEVEAILNPTTAQLLQDSGTSGSGAGSDASISASSPYCIFSEAGQELLQCQLSACQIYDNEVLVRDFIPVLRNSDNKPGLLDRVNNQFYTNAGTGEFIYYE